MSNDELRAKLQRQFCPPLDTSTVLAIISDYDLADPEKLQDAIASLEFIAATAAVEEDSGFDPSGSGGLSCHVRGDPNPVALEDGDGAPSERTSSSPDDVSLSTGLSSMDLEEDTAACIEHDAQLESLNPEEKTAVITSIFSGVSTLDVEFTLKRCRYNAGKAIEELLNIVFLEETGSRPRGVDGFSGTADAGERRKKGRRKKQEDIADSDGPAATAKTWDVASREIEFISKHSKHVVPQVTTLYHKNGASTPKTILAILDAQQALHLEYDDPNFEIYAAQLASEFPSIATEKVKALAELTYPTAEAGRELARALSRPDLKKRAGGITLEFRHPPPLALPAATPATTSLPSSLYPTDYPTTPTAPPPRSAAEARALRDRKLAQATRAYQKGNANNFHGAAAAYYAAQAREYGAVLRARESEEAERLVGETRWRGGMDLHGVGVRDAVRIARAGVMEWWEGGPGRGEAGGARGSREPYRVVTGLGRHSVGGAKLGPAVARMLIREGWKVEVGTGILLVAGVATERRK